MADRKKHERASAPRALRLAAMGIEAECSLVVDDQPTRPEALFGSPRDFIRGELVHREGTSYHLPMGPAVYFDTGVIEVATPVKAGTLTDDDVLQASNDFEARYAQLFGEGSGFREAGVQFITYRVFGTGTLPFKPQLPEIEVNLAGGDAPVKERRRAMLDLRAGWQDVDVYDYTALKRDHKLPGPAIVEAPTTTVVIPPTTSATVDHLGDDCDDADPDVHPGATDAPYDGVDTNCDGRNDDDADHDGHADADHGGDDCDDADFLVHPGVADAPYDGVDANCDGAEPARPAGELRDVAEHLPRDRVRLQALHQPGLQVRLQLAEDREGGEQRQGHREERHQRDHGGEGQAAGRQPQPVLAKARAQGPQGRPPGKADEVFEQRAPIHRPV